MEMSEREMIHAYLTEAEADVRSGRLAAAINRIEVAKMLLLGLPAP